MGGAKKREIRPLILVFSGRKIFFVNGGDSLGRQSRLGLVMRRFRARCKGVIL
jgi:hypothetical protein